MPESPLISVRGVSKKYCQSLRRSLLYAVRDIGGELLVRGVEQHKKLRQDEFWAVKDVSFDLSHGQSLALVGRNGAGKSTVLKMINGLIKPDTGSITIRGRVGALIELGAGFNPVLTGRENIFVNAAVLGIPRRDVNRKLDAIIDFAEVDRFIDMPLKSYSSGMRVRLGFAVAAQLEPDILLIDEVLAVGDAGFRTKCYRRLSEMRNRGAAFVVVSHNHHTLLTVCDRAVGLDTGELIAAGSVKSVLNAQELRRASAVTTLPRKRPAREEALARIARIGFRNQHGAWISSPRTGEVTDLCIVVEAKVSLGKASMGVIIRSGESVENVLAVSADQDHCLQPVGAGLSEFRLRLSPLGLPPSRYVAKVSVYRPPIEVFDHVVDFDFVVLPGAHCGDSQYYNPRSWAVVPGSELTPSELGEERMLRREVTSLAVGEVG